MHGRSLPIEATMRAVLLTLLAVVCYAAQNVIIERKLAPLQPLVVLLFFDLGLVAMVGAALLVQRQQGQAIILPPTNLWPLIVVTGALLFVADVSYVSAYHARGSLMTITTMVTLVPVVASALKAGLGGGLPSGRQLLGWAFALIAVVLVSSSPPAPK